MSGINIIGMSNVMELLDYDEHGTARYVVGTNTEYAVHVEFGTADQQAQPYLRPAVDRAVRKIDNLVSDVDDPDDLAKQLAREIEREAKQEAPVDTGNLKNSIESERL